MKKEKKGRLSSRRKRSLRRVLIAAAAVLWRLPPNLKRPPRLNGTPIPPASGEFGIQEETTDE